MANEKHHSLLPITDIDWLIDQHCYRQPCSWFTTIITNQIDTNITITNVTYDSCNQLYEKNIQLFKFVNYKRYIN